MFLQTSPLLMRRDLFCVFSVSYFVLRENGQRLGMIHFKEKVLKINTGCILRGPSEAVWLCKRIFLGKVS